MQLELNRYSDNGNSTLGVLLVDGKFNCYTLEDEARSEKLNGETRIPQGTYRIKFRKVLSPLTRKYREKYDWFEWHLELQDVRGFKYVYVHIGNFEDHTDACILVGQEANNNTLEKGMLKNSMLAFKDLYEWVSLKLKLGAVVLITIRDLERKVAK